MKDSLSTAQQRILLFSVFVLSLCGITYELVLGSLATYLLGNPVQQYSITIGFFLSSMGLGSYLSRYIVNDVLKNFIRIEIALGFAGGLSVIVLNFFFSFSAGFYMLHIFMLVLIGTLVGLEIPLLTRILKRYGALRDILSNVLSLDYLGGLAGSLLFPLILFPFVGRILTCLIIGIANISVAVLIIARIDYPGKKRSDFSWPIMALLILTVLAFKADVVSNMIENRYYTDDIVFSRRSTFQQIVLTRNGNDFRLYLDGSLQFSTYDEYRYHEMLVFPAVYSSRVNSKNVLVLGGGDGIAVREILKCDDVKSVTLVELDPLMLEIAMNNSSMREINRSSLSDRRVRVVTGDAYDFLVKNSSRYDVIIADFPDPHDETISKLYTVQFFRLIKKALAPSGVFVTQSTSPLFARDAYWCVHNTMKEVFREVVPYHVFVPTFGDWGFNIAADFSVSPEVIPENVRGMRYFNRESFRQSMFFPEDSSRKDTEVNTFNRPVLYTYYISGWKNVDY